MKKIISLFQRNYDTDRLVRNEVVPGAEWVLAGEGVATRKFDGACCMMRDEKFYKRYEVKAGKTPPDNFEAAGEIDTETGKQQGWVPVDMKISPEDKWFRAAYIQWTQDHEGQLPPAGTYEAIGPHFGGGSHITNPECRTVDMLEPHGKCVIEEDYIGPRTFENLKRFFTQTVDPSFEGIVWHHPDGRMVKIKAKDFGTRRKV